MKLVIEIDISDIAMEDVDDEAEEIRHILDQVGEYLEKGEDEGVLFDSSHGKVGEFYFEE